MIMVLRKIMLSIEVVKSKRHNKKAKQERQKGKYERGEMQGIKSARGKKKEKMNGVEIIVQRSKGRGDPRKKNSIKRIYRERVTGGECVGWTSHY